MYDKIRMDKIKNKDICNLIRIAPIEDKIRENCLWWFDLIGRRSMNAVTDAKFYIWGQVIYIVLRV